jgi:hypothetical protein
MLRITQLEGLEALLLELPGLVRQQEQRSPTFANGVLAWLGRLEEGFNSNRLHHAGLVATLRSALIEAARGLIPPEVQFRGRPTRTRVLTAVATRCLRQATELASPLLQENRARLEEAERVCRQLVAAAVARDLVPGRAANQSNTEFLCGIRQQLATAADLATAAVHVEGLVGTHDMLILIDRALVMQRAPD